MEPPISTIAFLVENKPGVLFNVTNLFRRRGFNIESITVGPMENPELARMTVSVKADARIINQIIEQLDKMVDVIKVKRLDPMRTVMREMVLIKLNTIDPLSREEALRCVNEYHGLILDIEPDSIVVEITGEPTTINEFIRKAQPLGVIELSRTGVTALEKGHLKL
ncbi:MAG: acetolactate synthase small subunit [Candidatus Bathyarchaeia archaeon]